ncbi:ISPg7, transposase family protein [Leptospira noguchii str. 2007001578]|uniref:ISPg7, transposase family protein n=1 Tax=Leptospira noguchii str. 2007001578 TaxID=1049974 RepID=A0ABP2TA83_9LEPT|nr:ISPg7, transposase family protein [Leptospira noguchii str. 2007001578]
MKHDFPCDPTSLVKWRKRIGSEGVEKFLEETILLCQREGQIKEPEFRRVNVDTTVQEKAITFPTDAKLYHKMRQALVKEASKEKIQLRQSYKRKGKLAFIKQGRYFHAKQSKRAHKETKRLKTYLGCVKRDIERKVENPNIRLKSLLEISERILTQSKNSKNKIYSIHSPEVECISKGKSYKRYEFGCKVSLVTTSKSNWVVGVQALHDNPYDGHTLKGCHQSDVKNCWSFDLKKFMRSTIRETQRLASRVARRDTKVKIIILRMFKFIFPIKAERK